MSLVSRQASFITFAIIAVIAVAALVLGPNARIAFSRNLDSLASIEGITPETVGRLRTIDGLHLSGPDRDTGFDAVLADRKTLQVDDQGIVMSVYTEEFVPVDQAGPQYSPHTIATTVMTYVTYRTNPRAVEEIRRYLDFLISYADKDTKGNLLLPYRFDYPSIKGKAPWYSAMDQAASASAFLWGHRLTGDPRYLNAAVSLVLALESPIRPPFLVPHGRGFWPKEYPAWEYSVLDGSLAALVGIWDLARTLPVDHPRHGRITKLLESVKIGILDGLPCFTSRAFGHFYADGGYSLGPGYQTVNIRLLSYLSGLNPVFGIYADKFSVASRGWLARAWYAAVITGRDFLANRGLIAKHPPPCIVASTPGA
tara:strand:- start:1784 stop:2890 length:1107 start_codon:yes stop_codon:yes gene_type:complete